MRSTHLSVKHYRWMSDINLPCSFLPLRSERTWSNASCIRGHHIESSFSKSLSILCTVSHFSSIRVLKCWTQISIWLLRYVEHLLSGIVHWVLTILLRYMYLLWGSSRAQQRRLCKCLELCTRCYYSPHTYVCICLIWFVLSIVRSIKDIRFEVALVLIALPTSKFDVLRLDGGDTMCSTSVSITRPGSIAREIKLSGFTFSAHRQSNRS